MCKRVKSVVIAVLFVISVVPMFGDAIHRLSYQGNLDKVKELVTKDPKIIHAVDKDYGATPFIWAVAGGKKDVISFLVEKGADINAMEPTKTTALHVAAMNGHTEIVQYLVSFPHCKADVAANDGNTPLINAAYQGHKEICRLLVSKKAKLDAVNKNKRSVAFFAAANGDTQLAEMAVTKGVDVNLKDVNNVTAIQAAVYNGRTQTVGRLITLGADKNVKDNQGGSLLHIACKRGHKETAQLLLKLKLGIDDPDDHKRTPLDYARAGNHEPLVALLTANGAKESSKSGKLSDKPLTGPITITILTDNYIFDEGKNLKKEWGFACLVEGTPETILFDTGLKPETLLHNVKALNVDLKTVKRVVISHDHMDHRGGLDSVLKIKTGIPLHLPYSCGYALVAQYGKAGAKVVTIKEPLQLYRGVWLTGEMGENIKEHSMILDTAKGLVVINGCSHPGVVEMVARAKEMLKKDVYLVFGGFHLMNKRPEEITQIITDLKKLGVKKVGATHCTGEAAIKMFKEAFKENFEPIGVGKVLVIK